MMLVYNLPATEAIYQRFAGIDGSAYFVGGFGMTALTANESWWFRSAPASGCASAPMSATSNSRRARPGTRSDAAQIPYERAPANAACQSAPRGLG